MSDYNPQLPDVIMYEGDSRTLSLVIPEVAKFTSASGVLIDNGDSDKTSTYCSGTPVVNGNAISTHAIGTSASGTAQEGDYRYYITGVYDGGQSTTWFWPISISQKLGGST